MILIFLFGIPLLIFILQGIRRHRKKIKEFILEVRGPPHVLEIINFIGTAVFAIALLLCILSSFVNWTIEPSNGIYDLIAGF